MEEVEEVEEGAREQFTKVGDCYVHGIMQGEALDGLNEEPRTIILR